MKLYKRVAGGLSRRLGRPELLAAVDRNARQAQQDELATSAVLAAVLPSSGSYVDVGTNRGQVLREALRISPHGAHYAFEPIPALAEELARAFPQVECRPLALGSKQEVTQFCHFTRLDGWSGLRRHPTISDEQGAPVYIEVNVSTLDVELADVTPSVIKIDVEGAELAVLEGGQGLLARAHPTLVIEHVPAAAALYGDPPAAVWDLLDGLGYRIFSLTGEGPFTRDEFLKGETIVNWLATSGG